MIADVPLGAFLSGGIDSSAVVAAMAEASPAPVRTFSIGFDHERFDELPHARAISQRFGTIARGVRRPRRRRGDRAASSCATTASRSPTPPRSRRFQLAALTRTHVTVALNGDGGDESFAGYQRYVANAVAGRLDAPPGSRCAEPSPRSRAASARTATSRAARTSSAGWPGRSRCHRPPATPATSPGSTPAQRAALYTPDVRGDGRRPTTPSERRGRLRAAPRPSTGCSRPTSSTYLVDDLIAKVDIATMAHGLEARSPLLDHELMELAASIPGAPQGPRRRRRSGSSARRCAAGCPTTSSTVPSRASPSRSARWLRDDLRTWASDILLDPATLDRGHFRPEAVRGLLDRHAAGADGDAKRIWQLLMLELWQREFVTPAKPELEAAA